MCIPQMAPMNWLILFTFFNLLFMSVSMKLYYLVITEGTLKFRAAPLKAVFKIKF